MFPIIIVSIGILPKVGLTFLPVLVLILLMRTILREPLLHFVIIAAALLALNSFMSPLRRPVVEISAAAVDAQAAVSAQRLGHELTPEERGRLTDEMLQEEILFREAQKRGMVSDNQVRNTLIAMMRSALKPMTAEPTDEELIATRAKLPRENTTLPQQVSFEHVSFTRAENVPADLLAKLRGGENPKALGEPLRLANPLPPTYRPQIERLTGKEFSDQVFVQPIGEWQGPLTSSLGVHFVRVIDRQAEQPLALEAIKPMLESHWMSEKQGDAVEREVNKLKENYRIILPKSAATKEVEK